MIKYYKFLIFSLCFLHSVSISRSYSSSPVRVIELRRLSGYTNKEIRSGESSIYGMLNNYVKNHSEWANVVICFALFFLTLIGLGRRDRIKKLIFPDKVTIVVLSRKAFICREIDNYLETHYCDETLNLEKLSQQFRFSREYLIRCYKNENNRSILKRLIQIRVDKAKELMIRSSKNITEIAFEVGFNSLEVFIRNFKRIEGLTPFQYKKKIINSYTSLISNH